MLRGVYLHATVTLEQIFEMFLMRYVPLMERERLA